jgi:mRNA interferase MazF
MTGYEFGDIVLIPFPFTDQTTTKKRPAVVVSSRAYHEQRPDVIVMAVTSQVKTTASAGDVTVTKWEQAGLLKPSAIKPILATIEPRLVIKKLGRLQDIDRSTLKQALQLILG